MSSDEHFQFSLNKAARLRMEENKKKSTTLKARKLSVPRTTAAKVEGSTTNKIRSGVRSRSISRNKPAALKTKRKARIVAKKKKEVGKEKTVSKKAPKRKKKSQSSSEESEEEQSESAESSASSSSSSEEE
ncbi:uncharacterized protein isoform X1 [Rhodnius prolixus]|uniref:Uncharacterized protein n=1 Tax=Rhodnius prolixus TaxID=13249 RepID=T1HGK1_RHOPR